MAHDEDPQRVRQSTKRGNTRGILIISLIIVILLLGGAYFYFAGQDTGDVVDGVVVDPDSEPVEENGTVD
ncbi:hypothetical protein [Fodinicurvata sp. EGI_FJ10296]|uniref:hypothetical protein n=1 Tax=Fodinicurvata sp. EGI_FJ10296 TaxID=3231908 RepID=UPI00345415A7